MKRMFIAPVIGAFVFAVATPAFAQWGGTATRRPSYGYGSGVDTRQLGYDNGFREGLKEGEKDGRRGDRYWFQDEQDFQRADQGYRSQFGNRDLYRQAFKTGFADGYSDGYRRNSRGYGYGQYGRNRGNGAYGTYGQYDPRYGGYGQQPGYYSIGYDTGFRDGIEKGREDIRKNRSFDARRHEWYREGDHDYSSRYGSRDQYKVEYRQGFNAGYAQGYRYGY